MLLNVVKRRSFSLDNGPKNLSSTAIKSNFSAAQNAIAKKSFFRFFILFYDNDVNGLSRSP